MGFLRTPKYKTVDDRFTALERHNLGFRATASLKSSTTGGATRDRRRSPDGAFHRWRRGESNPHFSLAKAACSHYHYAPGEVRTAYEEPPPPRGW
jgi:hypothetical protein